MERRRLKPRRGPVIKKARFNNFTRLESEDSLAQEPYITGANLERAKNYLESLEKDRKQKNKQNEEILHYIALARKMAAETMFSILAGTEETSKRVFERACGNEKRASNDNGAPGE
ncbi:unknown [Clostridium sp. CAG:149]|nr:unknown [Clostridium sp. CAG:149]